jgi:hypothetical protein
MRFYDFVGHIEGFEQGLIIAFSNGRLYFKKILYEMTLRSQFGIISQPFFKQAFSYPILFCIC